MFTTSDLNLIESKAISLEQVKEQLNNFKNGFPFLAIKSSASVEKGIKKYSSEEEKKYQNAWLDYLKQNKDIQKFVPASGAASRMFKDLFEFLDSKEDQPISKFIEVFFDGIKHFAFYETLGETFQKNEGEKQSLDSLKSLKTIIEYLLLPQGLSYGQLPKGLILFHSYPEGPRTAMEEHLVEGALYACNSSRQVNVHFTVSPEHKELFQQLCNKKIPIYEQQFDVKFTVSFSEQKSSTDTIAADSENQPFRDEKGNLVFRPGGHGALIENLNDLSADVVFIKNIDNVVPDSFKDSTVRYKQLIAGVLVNLQQKIFNYLELIDSGQYSHDQLLEMLYFLQDELCVKNPETKYLEDGELVLYIKSKLNRPLRVCGMVRNTGEPGGGPFLTINTDGTTSPQILESSQIDLTDPEKKSLFEKGTHFNPVDLVCALKDYKGNKFYLPDYVDK
ncbi:DUF4301 family protein, partial [Bacteroidales bacterium OttesenSCG-928-A17]|nr:DUF4301 family protein [Bacteroidales bacterium OttesenSCG-928-A17]